MLSISDMSIFGNEEWLIAFPSFRHLQHPSSPPLSLKCRLTFCAVNFEGKGQVQLLARVALFPNPTQSLSRTAFLPGRKMAKGKGEWLGMASWPELEIQARLLRGI